MLVSIVIPAFNAQQQLRLLLRTLAHCSVDPEDSIEVVVVDDGSSDGTGEAASSLPLPFPVTCLQLPRHERSSRAAARNAGLTQARGELILMLDADQVVGPTLIREHIRYHRMREDLVVVGPRSDLGAGDFDEAWLAKEFSFEAVPPVTWPDPRVALVRELAGNFNQLAICWHLMWTCNVSVRSAHVRAVGGFDEDFLGWGLEDSELGYRLRRHGLAFAFNAAAVAYHQRSRGVDAAMYADLTRNLALMVAKHDAPEVALQSVIGLALNPADRRLPWIEAARRFEFAARALAGRLPLATTTYHLVIVDETTAESVASDLATLAASRDLLLIDYTTDAALAGPIQCVDTPRELRYYHQPSADDRSAILGRFLVAG